LTNVTPTLHPCVVVEYHPVKAARIEHSAEDPIARYERRLAWYRKRQIVILLLVMLLSVGPLFAVLLSFRGSGWLQRPWALPFLIGTPVIIGIGLSAWLSRLSPPKQFYTDAVLAPRSDSLQQQRWPVMLFYTAVLGILVAGLILQWTQPPPYTAPALAALSRFRLFGQAAQAVSAACVSFLLLAYLLGGRLYGPPALQRAMDDELTVVQRAKAVTTGFLVLLGALAALMAVGAFAPPIVTRMGLIVCAYGGLSAASIRFALLERAAWMAARDE